MTRFSQDEEDEVVRCRRVREDMDRRFSSLDDAFARLESLAKQRKRKIATALRTKAKHKKSVIAPASPVSRKYQRTTH